jgi:succinate dehydrogenase/fumarate reductase flavoprotein subunit
MDVQERATNKRQSSTLEQIFPNAPPVRSNKFLLHSISRSTELGENTGQYNYAAMRDYINELMAKDASNKEELKRSKDDIGVLKTELERLEKVQKIIERQNDLDEQLLMAQGTEISKLQYSKRPG